jgi:hypothetical protein
MLCWHACVQDIVSIGFICYQRYFIALIWYPIHVKSTLVYSRKDKQSQRDISEVENKSELLTFLGKAYIHT